MSRKKIIWIIVGSVAVALFVLAFVMSAINAPAPEPKPTGNGGGGTISTATPTPTPTLEPEHEHNHDGGDALGEESATFDEAKPAYAAAAEGFLTEYLRWDSNESAEDRAARLAPFVAADSDLLTRTPGISLVNENPVNDYKSVTSLIQVTPGYTGWGIPDDATGNQLFMSVFGDYQIEQTGNAGLQNTFWQSSGKWTIQFADWEGSPNPVIIDVREPAYID